MAETPLEAPRRRFRQTHASILASVETLTDQQLIWQAMSHSIAFGGTSPARTTTWRSARPASRRR